MLDVIAHYPNPVKVNDQVFMNGMSAYDAFKNTNQAIRIDLNFTPAFEQAQETPAEPSTPARIPADGPYYRIKVKPYMCKPANEGFDFMEKFNDNIPMPHRIMEGRIVRETKGMYRMELHGLAKVDIHGQCCQCGRTLTHPVSKIFGIGPECGGHAYNTNMTPEELKEAMDKFWTEMKEVKWTGWVIKSAIQEKEEIECPGFLE